MQDLAHRAAVGVAGASVVLVGLVLVPLPGPGWPVVFAGISLLGREFPWARRLCDVVRGPADRVMTWSAAAAWPVRAGLGVCVVVSTAAPVLLVTGLP